jgi:hypothetical protein
MTFSNVLLKQQDSLKDKIVQKVLKSEIIKNKIIMTSNDMATFNQAYTNIERPYANVDLSKLPSWDLVMSIMEQQALEARRQIMARYHESQMMMPMTVNNIEYHPAQYTSMRNVQESDNSSYCSEEMDSSPAQSSDSDISQSESDIEIDVDSIEEENDDFFVPSIDDIPITVLQLETKLRERDLHKTS